MPDQGWPKSDHTKADEKADEKAKAAEQPAKPKAPAATKQTAAEADKATKAANELEFGSGRGEREKPVVDEAHRSGSTDTAR